jgi:DNA ligase-1
MITREQLYKRTATGATQVWWMEIDGARYRTNSGQLNGKIITTEWTVAKGKNIGRSNETTPEEQAIAEADSAYTLKRKGGYCNTPDDAQSDTSFKPMLAKKFEDYVSDIRKGFKSGVGVYSQPKLDGIRCIGTPDGLFSRQGNRIVAVPHIEAAVKQILARNPGIIFDGELYNHDLKADFNAIVSLVKKQKPTKQDLLNSEEMIEYHIYDVAGASAKEYPFARRYEFIEDFTAMLSPNHLRAVPTHTIFDESMLDGFYEEYIEHGYEGQMIRLHGPYEQKRSKLLLKRKEFMDDEYAVLDIQEGEGNASGMAKIAVLSLGDGRQFRADIVGERNRLREILAAKNRLIGKQATIEFFRLTPDGVPRFPKLKIIHLEGRW